MKKVLYVLLILLLVGCGNEKENESIKNYDFEKACCIDSGGRWQGKYCGSSEFYDEELYEKCLDDYHDAAKRCCNDFSGHWNSYKNECSLENDNDNIEYNNCIDDRAFYSTIYND